MFDDFCVFNEVLCIFKIIDTAIQFNTVLNQRSICIVYWGANVMTWRIVLISVVSTLSVRDKAK